MIRSSKSCWEILGILSRPKGQHNGEQHIPPQNPLPLGLLPPPSAPKMLCSPGLQSAAARRFGRRLPQNHRARLSRYGALPGGFCRFWTDIFGHRKTAGNSVFTRINHDDLNILRKKSHLNFELLQIQSFFFETFRLAGKKYLGACNRTQIK